MSNQTATTWSEDRKHVAEAANVERIALRFGDANVAVGPTTGENIIVEQTQGCGRRLTVQVDNGVLTAESVQFARPWTLERLHILVLIPAVYHRDLDISVSSGHVSVSGINLRRLDCSLRSAMLQITGCTAAAGLRASVHSGRMELANVETDDLVLSSASGVISCEQVVCSNLTTSTHAGRQELGVHAGGTCRLTARSGCLRFAGSASHLETDTKSGAQHLEVNCIETARLRAVSGSLELTVPEAPDLRQVDLRMVSGHASLKLPPQITPVIDMRSVSGGCCRCRQQDFYPGGRPVQINTHVTSGKVQITSAASRIA